MKDYFSKESQSEDSGQIRWKSSPEYPAIFASLVRAEREYGGCRLHEDALRYIGESYGETDSEIEARIAEERENNRLDAEALAANMLQILSSSMVHWRHRFATGKVNLARMTPKEHQEAIAEVSTQAKRLLERIEALDLPINLLAYYDELWPSDLEKFEATTGKSFGTLELALAWRSYGTSIVKWLVTLSDIDRVNKVAPTSPLRKANVKDPELNYVVRLLARFFFTQYGQKLPSTIEKICAIEFPDQEISADKIHSILKNFDQKQKYGRF